MVPICCTISLPWSVQKTRMVNQCGDHFSATSFLWVSKVSNPSTSTCPRVVVRLHFILYGPTVGYLGEHQLVMGQNLWRSLTQNETLFICAVDKWHIHIYLFCTLWFTSHIETIFSTTENNLPKTKTLPTGWLYATHGRGEVSPVTDLL